MNELTGAAAPCSHLCYCERAANRAEIERLRAALKELADAAEIDMKHNQGSPHPDDFGAEDGGWWSLRTENAIRAARAHEQSAPGEREYDPNVMPCDDAEFGMKP